jgi:hypothetical protein
MDDDRYSTSGSIHGPDDTVPDSQPPRGGHILERSPIRVSTSTFSTSSRYPLRSTLDQNQAHHEEECLQWVQQCHKFVGSRNILPRQGQ